MMFQNKYKLNKKQANEVLQNVFKSCEVEPSTDSFDKLRFKGYKEVGFLQFARYIAIFFLMLCAISPLAIKKDEYLSVMKSSTRRLPVIIDNHELFDDHFTITLFGDDILYGEIYAISEGTPVFPSNIDIPNSTVTFPYDGKSLDIHIPVKGGNELNAVLSEKNK